MKSRKTISLLLVFTMILGLFPSSQTKAQSQEYEIYPKVQKMEYLSGETDLSEVNLVLEDGLDEATLLKAEEILKDNSIKYSKTKSKVDNKTNILVGVKGSNGYVDNISKTKDMDASIFSKYDSYYLEVANGEIYLLGKDTDGAFYGLVTLKHILKQAGSKMRNLKIHDFANTKMRGFIEGFYGIPWSDQDRMSLMKFGGEFKMTTYIFAPKDDTYHKGANAFNLYPQERLAEIGKMARVGNMTKTKFMWTIHPFGTGDGRNASKYDENLKKIIAKFEQLYSVGVRQFGVLGDDVGNLDRGYIIRLMNALNEWRKSKKDVYEMVFCPVGYNTSWTNFSELNDYEFGINGQKGFDKDINIFWTGETVIGRVTQQTVNNFKTRNIKSGETERRDPVFWLNWPVIDYTWKRMLIGKGEMIDKGVTNLAGLVTNPMQEAEASKVSLFAVADFSWNGSAFNQDRSWQDSMKYISNVPDAFYELAKHMSDPAPNGHGSRLLESEEIKAKLDNLLNKLKSKEKIGQEAKDLQAEFNKIIKAGSKFLYEEKNQNLVKEMRPFVKSLMDLASAINGYLGVLIDVEAGNKSAIWGKYSQAITMDERSKTYERPHISGSGKIVEPGSKRLVPFKNAIKAAIGPYINDLLGDVQTSKPLTSKVIKTDRYEVYQSYGDDKVLDNNDATFAWYKTGTGDMARVGDYVGLDLGRLVNIGKVKIVAGGKGDYYDTYDLEYSEDGQTWTKYESYTQNEATKTINLDLSAKNIKARYIRIKNTTEKHTWMQMSTFNVEEAKDVSNTIITNMQDPKASAELGEDHSVLNFEPMTLKPGEYFGIKLTRIRDLSEIKSQNASGKIQVSKNGVEWFDAKEPLVDGRYVRIINDTNADLEIKQGKLDIYSKEIKPVKLVQNTIGGPENFKNAFDQNRLTQVQFKGSQLKGKYFVYDLGQTIDLEDIKFVSTDSEWDYPRHAAISVSEDGNTWTKVLELGNQDSDNPGEKDDNDDISYVLPDHEISYKTKSARGLKLKTRFVKFEITRTKQGSDKWIRFVEIELNGDKKRASFNDPTVELSMPANGDKRNLYDGNVASMFKPAEDQGNFVYNFSEKTDKINRVRIFSSASDITDAKVEAYVVTSSGNFEWVELGKIDNSYKEFNTKDFKNVLSVRVSWEGGKAPSINEIAVDEKEAEPVKEVKKYTLTFDMNGANEKYEPIVAEESSVVIEPKNPTREGKVFDGWYDGDSRFDFYLGLTKDTKIKAKWIGEEKPEEPKPDPEKVDKTDLAKKLEEAKVDEKKYKAETVEKLKAAISSAKAILNDDKASQKDVNDAIARLDKAIKGLVLKPSEEEEYTGWSKKDGKWYYYENGKMLKSSWRFLRIELPDGTIKKNWKYFNRNGENIIKFFHERNNTHLSQVGPNTEYAKGWYKLGRAWTYYKGTWGVRAEGEWLNLPVKLANGRVEIARKYFNKEGYSVSSFYRGSDNNSYYSLPGPDRYLHYGWKTLGTNKYYFYHPSGRAAVGSVVIGGRSFTFNSWGQLKK